MDTTYDARLRLMAGAISRRTALGGLGGAGFATVLGLAAPRLALASQAGTETLIEPEAGTWKTWILEAGDQLRP